MPFADQLTLVRIACAPIVVVLFTVDFSNHYYWGTVVFCLAMSTDWLDGREAVGADDVVRLPARRWRGSSVLCLVIRSTRQSPAWMVAAIVALASLVSGRGSPAQRGV